MSEYDDTDSDADGLIDSFQDAFACLSKVKSNTPRARFDIYFHSNSIQLIQFSVRKEVSNRYRIYGNEVTEMLRLPYSNDKQIFFVLHLKCPIVGGNKATTKYDFVVFNFSQDDHDDVNLDFDDPEVKALFDEDVVESRSIAGPTIEIFETLLTKIFAKDVTTPAKNYDGNDSAPALRCTFWDNDEHFLYPLDDGFVNVWKYCQKLSLKEVKNVRFVRSQGRFKTFDFYIYPKMERAIRRYNFGASKSNMIDCFYLEFKAIDQNHYDGLFAYCNRNKITINTNDFRESASDTDSNDDSEPDSQTPTETNASESSDNAEEAELIVDEYETPDPYMVHIRAEGGGSESDNSTDENGSAGTSVDERESRSSESSHANDDPSKPQARRRKRSRNVISDENESSSGDSIQVRSRKRSLRIDSDDETVADVQVWEKNSIIDSESD